MASDLTPKQRKFCEYYLQSGNATDAARKAGYSEKTAYASGYENLRKPQIQMYLEKQGGRHESERIAKSDDVLEYFTKVMRREESEHVVVTVKKRDSRYDKHGKKVIIEIEEPEIVEIPTKVSDATRAAEALARRYGLLDSKPGGDEKVVQIIDDI